MCLGVAALPGKRSGFDLESLVGRENNSRAFPTACWNPGIFGHPFLLGEREPAGIQGFLGIHCSQVNRSSNPGLSCFSRGFSLLSSGQDWGSTRAWLLFLHSWFRELGSQLPRLSSRANSNAWQVPELWDAGTLGSGNYPWILS